MPVLAVAHHVDDHVAVEFHAVVHGKLGDEHRGLRIVAVDMEHGGLHDLGHIRTVQRGSRVQRVAGREPDLVVHHDVNGPSRAVSPRLGQVQGFHHHALACDGGVPMDQDRNHFLAAGVATAFLACPH